jgi:hypothetical protein
LANFFYPKPPFDSAQGDFEDGFQLSLERQFIPKMLMGQTGPRFKAGPPTINKKLSFPRRREPILSGFFLFGAGDDFGLGALGEDFGGNDNFGYISQRG